jgi:hypothetical protein
VIFHTALAAESDWHAFKDADTSTVRKKTVIFAESKNEAERILATELLDQFPLYFNPELYYVLEKKLIRDNAANVRNQALTALYNVADGGFPSVGHKDNCRLQERLVSFLESIRGKQGYDIAIIDDLLVRLKNNPRLNNKLKTE